VKSANDVLGKYYALQKKFGNVKQENIWNYVWKHNGISNFIVKDMVEQISFFQRLLHPQNKTTPTKQTQEVQEFIKILNTQIERHIQQISVEKIKILDDQESVVQKKSSGNRKQATSKTFGPSFHNGKPYPAPHLIP